MRLLRGRSLRSDRGTSLVEMMVTIIVVGLLGTAVTTTVVSLTKHTNETKARDYATQQAQVTLDRTTRYLRAAIGENAGNSPFTYAGDNHVTFYSDLAQPNGPALVDFNVTGPATGGTLVESVTPADAGSSYTYSGVAKVGRDGSDIDTTQGPLFTYYNASGNVLATPMTTVAQTVQIARIKVSLNNHELGSTKVIPASTLIYLRNIEYS